MRHRCAGFKLGRDTEHRKILRRNQAISLFTYGQITTTVPKAKSVQPFVEKLITVACKGDLVARRRVIKAIGDPYIMTDEDDLVRNRYGELTGGPRVVKKLFDEIAPQYTDRQGGYTRIVRLGKHRIGDGGELCVLQLVGHEEGPQISGRYSRRRNMANGRMAFAARIRKRAAGESDETAESDVADAASATVEPPAPSKASEESEPVSDVESGSGGDKDQKQED